MMMWVFAIGMKMTHFASKRAGVTDLRIIFRNRHGIKVEMY